MHHVTQQSFRKYKPNLFTLEIPEIILKSDFGCAFEKMVIAISIKTLSWHSELFVDSIFIVFKYFETGTKITKMKYLYYYCVHFDV